MTEVPRGEPPALRIARFDTSCHDRSGFACGQGAIDNFLKSSLSDQIRAGMVAAYAASAPNDPAVLGFYTLGALAVRADHGPRAWPPARVSDVPAIYLRAVAVDEGWQGRGIGTALVINAMRRCVSISVEMAAAAIVLDVLQDAHFARRWAFYEGLGFRPLGDPDTPTRVFIPMADVRASLAAGSVPPT